METTAYLFTHFKGVQQTADDEQVYFAVSKDGYKWKNLNGGKPVLRSVLGEGGVRDPHIMRSHDGKKFYMIATDLYVYGKWTESKEGWYRCQREGSKSIMIWESEDLVHWSEQRMVQVAADDAACAWAPECIWDNKAQDYFVYWSSRNAFDGFEKQRVYCAHTKDFKSFSKPKIYIEREFSVIDTSMIYADGKYYRLTKNHDEKSIFLEVSDSTEGEFTEIETFSMRGVTGYEGPTAYKMNGENRWCILMDAFDTDEGYRPFLTKDLSVGYTVEQEGFETPDLFRHGTVMPITNEEYIRLVEAYGIDE
ncbi:MAG: glycoside hydrolase family 43 protein [bacterium]|nr:glycoside hydrolase family 43 protein [bacterium]